MFLTIAGSDGGAVGGGGRSTEVRGFGGVGDGWC